MKRLFCLLAFLVQSAVVLSQESLPYVILISFDGFRSDYVERFNLPNFKAFIKQGASAEALIPSFPSKTFPNHYTLVTGLYPGNHGLVDNSFYDPAKRKAYGMRIREAVIDPSYYGGTPLWQLAHQQGVKSASYFWVGSELKEEGLHPDYYFEYNHTVPFQQRVDQVIDWLNLPEAERPHLITLYFSSPDEESHNHGPIAEVTKQKVLSMDSLLGKFMQRIDQLKLPVNVILVSDHGMLELVQQPDSYLFLDELVASQGESITAINGGTQAHVYTDSEKKTDSLYHILKQKEKGFWVVKRKDFPARWHYDHERSGDLMILARPGKYIVTGDREKFLSNLKAGSTFGVHGYDPNEVEDMRGIFYASGPNIKRGINVKAFQNIHIYPLIAKILQLKTPPIDGKFEVLKLIYKK